MEALYKTATPEVNECLRYGKILESESSISNHGKECWVEGLKSMFLKKAMSSLAGTKRSTAQGKKLETGI